jgi:colanic acid/amylovoran biosynthesis glycosyltransferase
VYVLGNRGYIPNVILEVCALGTSAVATTAGAVPELVEHRKTGLLVSPANVEDLAQATGVLLGYDILRNTLREAAYEVVKRSFDIGKNTRELADLLGTYANA